MAAKRFKFDFLLYTALLLIVCFEKTVGKSHSHSHTSHSSHGSSHTHTGSHTSSHGSHGGYGGHGSSSNHPHEPSHSSNGGHGSSSNHPHESSHSSNGGHGSSSNYPHEPSHSSNGDHGSNSHHPYEPNHPSNGGHGSGYPPSYDPFDLKNPLSPFGKDPAPHQTERSPVPGWKPEVLPYPTYPHLQPHEQTGGSIGWNIPSHNTDHSSPHPTPNGPSQSVNHLPNPWLPVIIPNPVYHGHGYRPHYTTHRPYHHDPGFYKPENQNHLVVKPLVSEKTVPPSRTSCGKTLCNNVPKYPSDEINTLVQLADEKLKSGNLNIKGISKQNFTSNKSIFSYGRQDSSSSCIDFTNTIFPQEGYSSDDHRTYYVVNVPSLRQGVVNIQCQSTYQMCKKHDDVSFSKMCSQMYREEELLVLPSNKGSSLTINDFEFKRFHVPTGCNCIPY